MKRRFLLACSAEVVFLGLWIWVNNTGGTLWARVGYSLVAIPFAGVLASIFVLPALLAGQGLRETGRPRVAVGAVVLGVAALMLFDYIVFAIPTIADVWGICLEPGRWVDHACELGPL